MTSIVHDSSPSNFNSEPDLQELVSSGFLTPSHLLFNRNHGAVVDLPSDHRIVFDAHPSLGIELDKFDVSVQDLALVEQRKVICALQCAGNRRAEMSRRNETEGLQWHAGVIGNIQWSGALLRPILLRMGIPADFQSNPALKSAHVEFVSDQKVEQAEDYRSSISLIDAMDPESLILLATHMNNEPLTQAHGAPCRVVIPGHIGARSVKWLCSVLIRQDESQNFYQQSDYKVLPSDVTADEKADAMQHTPALQEFGITSVIAFPLSGSILPSRSIECSGYAAAGCRSRIAKVEVALVLQEGQYGQNVEQITRMAEEQDQWYEAELEGAEHVYAWVLWKARLTVPEHWKGKVALVSRAECQNGMQQPRLSPWNIRGIENRSWSVSADLASVPQ